MATPKNYKNSASALLSLPLATASSTHGTSSTQLTLTDATKSCENMNSSIVKITSAEENIFVASIFVIFEFNFLELGLYNKLWFALKRSTNYNEIWMWRDGSVAIYTNWDYCNGVSQPNDDGPAAYIEFTSCGKT